MGDNSIMYAILISWLLLFIIGIILFITSNSKDDLDFSLQVIIVSFLPLGNMLAAFFVFIIGITWLFKKGYKSLLNNLCKLKKFKDE